MLSMQGIICKDLKRQNKLPEKFKDLALEPSIDPRLTQFFKNVYSLKFSGQSSGSDQVLIPEGWYPCMRNTAFKWNTTSPYKIITMPEFTGNYFYLASKTAKLSNNSNMLILQGTAKGTFSISRIPAYNSSYGSTHTYTHNNDVYFNWCYLGFYTSRYFYPFYDLKQQYIANDDVRVNLR